MPNIMRIWRGEVPADRAPEYLERVTPIALADYRRIPGNRGAWVTEPIGGRGHRDHDPEPVGLDDVHLRFRRRPS